MTQPARAINASDIPKGSWVDRLLPAPIRPYARLMRLDRPIGTWLLLFPCWWGAALATPGWPSAWLIAVFALGAVVMRGAGCTYNDIVDRDFDGRVARTADRPIPSGQVSVRQAIAFLLAQMLVGFLILITFNWPTIWLGVLSLALVFTYPLMKRVTWWPQFFLGLAFNWGALMGYCAVAGHVSPGALAMYAAGIAWTLHYDTIYAHQDKEDDALVGVKSSALRLGARTRPALMLFSALTIALLALTAWLESLNVIFAVALAAAALHLTWQACAVRLDAPLDCLAKFHSNRLVGWTVLAGIIAAKLA